MVTGEASLYDYVDSNITKYFYETKKTPIEQLVYISYAGDNSFVDSVLHNYQFRQQLHNNVNCGKSEKDFEHIDYTRNPLVKHFVAYNACDGSPMKPSVNYDAAADGKREFFALRVIGGVYSSKISLVDPQTYYNKTTDLSQIIFKFGLEAEYILPFNKGSWSVMVNPTYQSFARTKTYTGYVQNSGFANNGDPIHYTAKVDYSSIEIPFGVRRYFFINSASKIFVNAAYVIDLSSGGTIEFTNSDGLVNATDKVGISSRNNFAIGLGYAYKRLSGELRYNLMRQLSERLSWDINYTSVGFNLGYKLL